MKVLDIDEPIVIVSNRELELMNATKIIFPNTTNLIYFWHVENNMLRNFRGTSNKSKIGMHFY